MNSAEKRFDTIVVGAGIAGLGVAGLLQRAGQNVLLVDRYGQVGGRMQSWTYKDEWVLDVGLHAVEMGAFGGGNRLIEKVGRKVKWGEKYCEKMIIYSPEDKQWRDLGARLGKTKTGIQEYFRVMKIIQDIADEELDSWDNRSLKDWFRENVRHEIVEEMIANAGMLCTTVLETEEMSAGECLWIMRENMRHAKPGNIIRSSYPEGGMQGMMDPLKDAFVEAGGTLYLNSPVEEILFDGTKAVGVAIGRNVSPYQDAWNQPEREVVGADRVVCALPLWDLGNVLPLDSVESPLPEWWVKRIKDIRMETTGLIGYMIGLSEPLFDDVEFRTALKLKRTGTPFQGYAPSNHMKGIAPEGKMIIHSDIVVEIDQIRDRFELNRLLEAMWEEMVTDMWPGMEEKVEWRIPYKCIGCDGLARKPMQTGKFKPDVKAPEIEGLYFAGDTYRGRGIGINAAANSAMLCAETILQGR